jgi:ParB family chromosome partitioning protein
METKKRALGMGLEQLFNNENLDLEQMERTIYENSSSEEIVELKLDELRPNPYQPRKIFDDEALRELSESIKEHGVFQPIIVKKSIKGYEIIAGERRYRASKLAGLKTIPAIIRDFTDSQMMEIALLENLQRENLNVIEEAIAYKSMIEKLNLTQDELSKKVGKSRSHVTNMIGLLKLPFEVKNHILNGFISMGHARVLSKLEDPEKIIELSKKVINEHLSVRALEEIASNPNYKRKNTIRVNRNTNEYNFVEDAFTDKIGNKVRIKNKKIVIPFNSEKDLERILEILNIDVSVD